MGADYPDGAVDEVLFWLADQGRLGRKSNAGFYAYSEKGDRLGLWEGLEGKYPQDKVQPSLADVQHRLLFAQVLEAVRALEEGVLTDIREGDVGAILGWGFAPWSGGPFSWLDMIGAPRAVEICRGLSAQFGPRFHAPKLLLDMAGKGETFYGRFGAETRAA
jgi:3-hydroxyacyl-CoA dehydrogenase/enoyl-CoA hydratase/3-hydroxybutyryl-CoA epimerase